MRVQLTMALRYLRGRKLRTALTTLAVVFGVAVLFGMNTLLPTMLQAFRQTVLATMGKVDLVFTSVTDGPFPADRIELVRGIEGIAEVTGSLRRNVLLPPSVASRAGLNAITLVGVEPGVAVRLRHYPLKEGRFLTDEDGDAIVVSKGLAEKLGLSIGSALTLPSATGTTDFEVVGILDMPSIPGVEEAFVPLSAAQRLLGMPGQINVIEAVVKPGVNRDEVEKAALVALGNLFKAEPPDLGEELIASLQMGEVAFAIMGVMALAIGAFIILNTFRTVVVERRHDLGMLRAVGASRRAVVGLILAESLLQGLLGTAIGLAAGYGLAWVLLLTVKSVMQQYLRMEAAVPIITLPNLLTAAVLGIGATLAGGLWPALSAGRVTPLEALRPVVPGAYERAAKKRGIVGAVLIVLAALGLLTGNFNLVALGTVLFMVGLVLVAPILVGPLSRLFGRLLALMFAREGRLAEGNLARQPNRAAVTASALMVGLAMVLALAGMVTSIFDGFMSYIDHSLRADFLLMPASLVLGGGNVGAGPELMEEVRGVPGVTGATTLRLGAAAVNGLTIQVIGVDPQTYPQLSGLVFRYGDPEEAFAALGRERAMIVNGVFAAQRRVRVGDVLTLQTPAGEREYRVVGVGSDYLNAKLVTAYISHANLERDFYQTADLLVMVEAAEDADMAAVQARLEKIVQKYPSFVLTEWRSFREEQERVFGQSVSLFNVIGVMFALPSLLAMVNTLTINVMERTREIGVLRAVGSTRRQIRRMVLAESLLLGALGTAFGILAGLWLGYVLVQGMNVSGFVIPYYFPYTGILVAVAVGLLIGVG
ncbi:MAG: FtsX-like permease family protein, partial [Anaerolineae bacterium]|nr:FtsX-like permease family protein [Anaerolineae bacterium]